MLKQSDKITIASLLISIVGLLVALLAGLLNPFAASIAAILILILGWMVWITLKILTIRTNMEGGNRETVALTANSLPYTAYYIGFPNQIVRVDNLYRKIKIPPTFLNLPRFTILFWVEITEDFFQTQNNRFLFSYTTNVADSSNYPNGFYLGLIGRPKDWRFIIKGNDPKNETKFKFSSSHILLGWKLFSIRFERSQMKLDLYIDAGHVFQDSHEIQSDSWPVHDPKCQFHLGGWQDNWPSGLSELRFYNFRVYERYLSNGDLETVLYKEGDLLKNA